MPKYSPSPGLYLTGATECKDGLLGTPAVRFPNIAKRVEFSTAGKNHGNHLVYLPPTRSNLLLHSVRSVLSKNGMQHVPVKLF